VHYINLFDRLRQQAVNRDRVLPAIQSYFFAAQFHCVDNIPHAIAQGLLAQAIARCYDGGLHRYILLSAFCRQAIELIAWSFVHSEVSGANLGAASERESRKRTAWACFV
jgi:hypothetical protein